jgi:acylphosphatase
LQDAQCGWRGGKRNDKSGARRPDNPAQLLIEEKPANGKALGMPVPGEVHHETIHYSGHVQGVGFRYTALYVARGFDVAGYVENQPDGRVCVEVEGDPEEVNAFIAAIGERMQGYVRTVERSSRRCARQYHGFTIR